MKVYIAAPWSALDQVTVYLDELAAIGYEPGCSWPNLLDPSDPVTSADQRAGVATKARDEVQACDVLVLLTADALGDEGSTSSGRHVEVGVALARRRPARVVVVGEPENAFHWLDQVDRVPDWHAATLHLARLLVDQPRRRKPREPRAVEAGPELFVPGTDIPIATPPPPNSYDVETP